MNTYIKVLRVFVLSLTPFIFTGCSNDSSGDAKVDKELAEMVDEVNKNCPVMADSETRLDSALALPGKIISYNYTLVNYEVGSLDTIEVKSLMEPNIFNTVITAPDMQQLRDMNTTFYYIYKDKAGKYFFKIIVTPEDYNNG